ncbi:hypothetical protein IAI10_10875 [Clostridium sp. 19966]|uniref:hypothetical protein n=1 Tax=Clostridium sp. 19966 TaxID=2768166 RepID=UPI0028DD8120|nr:hypothetical protein [Clostridium sp. 19966]MDT8717159.1 hypothetical protein [Clostridium sp. 19966]
MGKEYKGIIVEESLNDNRILNKLDIKKIHITEAENSKDRWHMYEVKVSKLEILEMSKHIIEDWYMHFWKEKEIIAVFKNKTFEFDYEIKDTWKEVLEYGASLGISKEQLDFPIFGL